MCVSVCVTEVTPPQVLKHLGHVWKSHLEVLIELNSTGWHFMDFDFAMNLTSSDRESGVCISFACVNVTHNFQKRVSRCSQWIPSRP